MRQEILRHGICNLGVIPGRAEAADTSEMVTQLLFGEHFSIIRSDRNWCFVRTAFDNYECWIDEKQFLPISDETFRDLAAANISCAIEPISSVENLVTAEHVPIVFGASLPFFDGAVCNLQGYEYQYEGQTNTIPPLSPREWVAELAYTYLNTPYLWGGRSFLGIDCSGLVQNVFKAMGYKLPRDAYQQASMGQVLAFVEEAKQGDLAFFDSYDGRIIHVGIVLNDHKIIHASGRVRVDQLDHQGIFNAETGKYTHQLRLIKRIL